MPGMMRAGLLSCRISSSSCHSSLLTARSLRLASSRLSGPRTGRTAPASDTANPILFMVGLYQDGVAFVSLLHDLLLVSWTTCRVCAAADEIRPPPIVGQWIEMDWSEKLSLECSYQALLIPSPDQRQSEKTKG